MENLVIPYLFLPSHGFGSDISDIEPIRYSLLACFSPHHLVISINKCEFAKMYSTSILRIYPTKPTFYSIHILTRGFYSCPSIQYLTCVFLLPSALPFYGNLWAIQYINTAVGKSPAAVFVKTLRPPISITHHIDMFR